MVAETNAVETPEGGRDFIRDIIATDLAQARVQTVVTRFPPEPNGYLHIGHAKSICLNFGVAAEFGGRCHLRFDDTNPTKEEQAFIDAIAADVRWLGFDWGEHLFHASDYFEQLYAWAEHLIRNGDAYVDDQSPDEMRAARGTLTEPGRNSPWRDRGIEENLALFRAMRAGKFPNGARVLRAKVDMAAGNINLRDPALYRILHATHPRTGDAWCIYPTYDYAHGQSDAIEGITHSLCTLEFEDHKPLYEWLLDRLPIAALGQPSRPRQYEFARLNIAGLVLSKRVLTRLVSGGHVAGWDDPRMPTLAGARRRGYTADGLRRFAERIGVSKAHQMIDYSILEDCMREHLNEIAPRRMAVLDPIKLVIENYPEGQEELMDVPNHPQKPEWGKRQVPFSRELWIERDDYTDSPPKGYFRLAPGATVRLRYGYVVKCEGYHNGIVRCTYLPETRSGTPGADAVKVKGNIHWVSVKHAHAAQVHLYDRLFKIEHPESVEHLNPDSIKTVSAQLEPGLKDSKESHVQFERHGYFICDDGRVNRTVTLRDSWAKH